MRLFLLWSFWSFVIWSKSLSYLSKLALYKINIIFLYKSQMTEIKNENDHFDHDHFDHNFGLYKMLSYQHEDLKGNMQDMQEDISWHLL